MRRLRTVKRLGFPLILMMATALGLTLVSPASASGGGARHPAARTSARTWHVLVGEQTTRAAIQGMAFLPRHIWIDVGDTVRWTANSEEPHTVSFINAAHPATPFDPSKAYMVTRTSEPTISAPGQYRNSGLIGTLADPALPPPAAGYRLKFTGTGTYHYICYVHGRAMRGVVHVAPAGTPYPHTQRFYNRHARAAEHAITRDGLALWRRARHASTRHHVFVGPADSMAMVMRFAKQRVSIRVGQRVTFDWSRVHFAVPHTVTFGPEIGPPTSPYPGQTPNNYRGGSLNSGVLMPMFGGPSKFVIRFTKAGRYHYFCAFHDGMGMVGTVIVR